MRLRNRLDKLEQTRTDNAFPGPTLAVLLNTAAEHFPLVAISTTDGAWRIERAEDESEETFIERAEASAPRDGIVLVLNLEREGGE